MGYIKDLQRMRCELECMNVSSLPEGKRASVVLSNAVNVYPVIANELTQRVSRLRGDYGRDHVFKMPSTFYSSPNELLKRRKAVATMMVDEESNAKSMS